jgi:RHS repeat-associated protein
MVPTGRPLSYVYDVPPMPSHGYDGHGNRRSNSPGMPAGILARTVCPNTQLTGLDYFGARYFSGAQGRFTSPDQPLLDQDPSDPQSWNLFSYVRNSPLRFTDPTGRECATLDNGTQGDDGKGTVCKAVTEADKNKKPDVTVTDFEPPSPMLLAVAQGAQQAGPVVNAAGYATGGVMAGAFAGMAYGAFAGGQAIGALGLTLLPSQARNIEAIENAIANHVTLSDLSGAAKETAGFTIRTGNKVWNHRQELIETARNLRGSVRALQGSLNDPRHGAVAREVVQQAIQKAETALRQIDAALRR